MKLKCCIFSLAISLLLSAFSGCAIKSSNDFDFDDAMKNIYLDGHKISLPLTLEDLGEGYSFLKRSDSEDKVFVASSNEGEVLTVVQKGEETVCFALFSGDTDVDYNEKCEIIGLSFFPSCGDIRLYDFSFFDRSKNEIMDFFGDDLQLSGSDESTTIYEYINSENNKILLVFIDEVLFNIEIRNKKE